MRYTTPMIITLTLLFSSTLIFAQGGRRKNRAKNDTIDISVKKPFLDVYYGNAQLSRQGMSGELSNTDILGIAIGVKKEKEHKESDEVIIQDKNGVSLTLGSAQNLQNSDSLYQGVSLTNTNALDFWSLGFINGTGYGYQWGSSTLMLTVEDNTSWTSINPRTYSLMQGPADWQNIMDFDGTMRLSSSMTSSLEFRVSNTVSINGGYTWNQVMPRHLFWYWMGSEIIEGLAGNAVDRLIENFTEMSPKSQPVMHFVLKSAVLYGMKEMRRKYMNWPFETASPMNITFWNIGVGLTL
ncbi:MAG: hypothetical protein ACKOX1_09420 [Ignavibacteria bacterium]